MKNFFTLSAAAFLVSQVAYLPAAIEVQMDKTQTSMPNQPLNGSATQNLDPSNNMQTTPPASVKPEMNKVPSDMMNTPKPADPNSPMTPHDASKDGFTTDHDLTKAIYKAIRDDRTFSSDSKIKIQVTVYNGKVTLAGDVKNEAEKERAALLANQVNKLKGVVNNIKVSK